MRVTFFSFLFETSINTINADTIFEPHSLYSTLDNSEGGIAEWIVPLVYAGHCDEIVWVKPEFAKQMTLGRKRISVGKRLSDGSLGIESKEPYFVDDFMFQKRCEMSHVQHDILLDVQAATSRPRCSGYVFFTFSQSASLLKFNIQASIHSRYLFGLFFHQKSVCSRIEKMFRSKNDRVDLRHLSETKVSWCEDTIESC